MNGIKVASLKILHAALNIWNHKGKKLALKNKINQNLIEALKSQLKMINYKVLEIFKKRKTQK